MKKSPYFWTLLSAFVMLGLPWVAVTFVKGPDGMAACFILFFAVDPLYCAAAGFTAGRDLRRLWPRPLLAALLFIAGAWLLFDPGEPAFLRYALIYLAIGFAAALTAHALSSKYK